MEGGRMASEQTIKEAKAEGRQLFGAPKPKPKAKAKAKPKADQEG